MLVDLPETIGSEFGPSVEGASPALLSEVLIALEVELRKQEVPVDEYLRPGASASDVTLAFDECGLVAPQEAIAWFQWRDGPTRSSNSHNVMPMFLMQLLSEGPRGIPTGSR